MKPRSRTNNPFLKRASRGFRGYPIGTIALYGPDDRRATKIAVGIVKREGGDVDELEQWFAPDGDICSKDEIMREIRAFLDKHNVVSVAALDRIIGCPHEEGIDYPEGVACPECPFWATRDRFTGEPVN
jgi:hypothetical protein